MLRFCLEAAAPAVFTFERIICAISDISIGVIGDCEVTRAGSWDCCSCNWCCEYWYGKFRPLGKVNVSLAERRRGSCCWTGIRGLGTQSQRRWGNAGVVEVRVEFWGASLAARPCGLGRDWYWRWKWGAELDVEEVEVMLL
jgi:hypothetical protein